MVGSFLLAMALQAPVVTASVNRTSVEYGDTLVLEIIVNSRGAVWVRLADPAFDGLEAYGSRQVSYVRRVDGEEKRRTERTIYLRATRTGEATIGEVRAQQGRRVTTTGAIMILVTGGPPDPRENPIVIAIIGRAPPPAGSEEPSVYVIPSTDTVMVGEQLDLMVVAWIPRDLRSRLRTAPTLQAPEFSGAWMYESALPTDWLEEREFNGSIFDVYVHHQTLFPLSNDGFSVDRATISYDLPLSDSFMSRELRHVVQSQRPTIVVLPQPEAEARHAFSGSTADSLSMVVVLSGGGGSLEVGGSVTMEITLSGRGNVVLWGEPEIAWPVGLNAYPGETSVQTWREAGRIVGTKVFRYLLVPDSIGRLTALVSDYGFFNPVSHTYEMLPGTAATVVARAAAITVVAATGPLTLMESPETIPLPVKLATVPVWFWIILVVAGPAWVFGSWLYRWTYRRPDVPTVIERTSLWHANRKLGNLLRGMSSACDELEGETLEQTLVAAGVEQKLASHTARVKDRLGKANYGPDAGGDSDELLAEVDEVVRALAGDREISYSDRLKAVLPLVLLLFARPAESQQLSAERLYQTGAFQTAADSFAVRAANSPLVAANWFNLGNALHHTGENGRAVAAWVRAGRLAPRKPQIRKALRNTTAWRMGARALVSPVTPTEAFLAAIILWLGGWLAVAVRRRRLATVALTLGLVIGVGGELVRREYRHAWGIVLYDDTPLREAPFGSSNRTRTLGPGEAVEVRQARGAWLLVNHDGAQGWMLSREIEHI